MKAVIDLKLLKDLENDDILVYRDGFWVNIRKDEYIKEVIECQKHIKILRDELDYALKAIRELRGED